MIERWLQIQLIVLSMIGLAMLGDLEQSRQLQFFFVIAAIASIFIVDVWKWTAVPRWAANLLALFAMVACARKFYSGTQVYQLSAVADLLLYLQLILFFQQKQQRVYWVLLVLGLLRVIVAATIEPEASFAPLLLAFVAAAISTLTCFYMWREEDRVRLANRASEQNVAAQKAAGALRGGEPRTPLESARALVATPIEVEYLRPVETRSRRVLWSVIRETFWITIQTLIIASIFFALLPRVGEDGWAMARLGQAISGFSPDVQLQPIASLQQNPDPVLRVRLEDLYSKRPVVLDSPLYVQGNVLRWYGRSGGGVRYGWRSTTPNVAAFQEINTLPAASGQDSLVRQTMTLDLPVRGTLFAVYPVFRANATPHALRLVDKGNHLQGGGTVGFEYSLLTTAFEHGRQNELRPLGDREDGAYIDLTEIERPRFRGLIAKCNAILKASPGAESDRIRLAQTLSEHFQTSGEYAYTLDRSDLRIPPGVDPIEEFVTTSKKGYCQYFASALALMLRSRDIPCRLVNGYCTSEYNEVGDYYQVRQHHAHVWVEVFLTPKELAVMGSAAQQKYPRGAWMRFDPTPEASLPAYQPKTPNVANDSMNFAQLLWRDYVVGLNQDRQKKMVYEPFKSTFFDSVRNFFKVQAWRDWLSRVRQTDGIREFLEGNWFNWRGGLAAMTFCAGIYFLVQFFRWALGATRAWVGRKRTERSIARARSHVEFYDRFESILRGLGITRPPNQTPREFVSAAEDAIEAALGGDGAKNLRGGVQSLIETYYRVRYGEYILEGPQRQQIDEFLDALSRPPPESRL